MDTPPNSPKNPWSVKRLLWLSLGLICVTLGTVGLFLPLLPTTSFMLLAAFSFARSSPRLHRWLVSHRTFGPLISDWQAHKAISRRAKVLSLISMGVILGVSALLKLPLWVLLTQLCVLGCVAVFIVSRPTPPQIPKP